MPYKSPAKSFIPVKPESHFPVQNLPYGIFKTGINTEPRAGIAIGDYILDLSIITKKGLIKCLASEKNVFTNDSLNEFMSLGKKIWHEARIDIQKILDADNPIL